MILQRYHPNPTTLSNEFTCEPGNKLSWSKPTLRLIGLRPKLYDERPPRLFQFHHRDQATKLAHFGRDIDLTPEH